MSAKFRFHGISAHAAGAPERGRSALDAVEAVFTVAMASQISGIEAVVYIGERSAKTAVITEFAPSAAITS